MPSKGIAAQEGIDLIVMPRYSRNGFNSLVPGSFAELVSMNSHVPILLIDPEIATVGVAPSTGDIQRSSIGIKDVLHDAE